MSLTLKIPTLTECQQARLWRNDCLEAMRTPHPLTEAQQEEFYKEQVSCSGNHRYWSIYDNDEFVAFGGLTHISKENKNAEISLIVDKDKRANGYGVHCVWALLDNAFRIIGLETVFGECYFCNIAGLKFWGKIVMIYNCYQTILPRRKIWDNQLWDSMYFSITKDDFNK